MKVWQKRIGYVVSMGMTALLLWFGKIPPDAWLTICIAITGMFIGGVAGERIVAILKKNNG